MAEYGVGAGGDFKTLSAAAAAAKPGDVMTILPGTYKEAPTFVVPNVEWRAAEPGTVIIDGGWNGKTTTDKFPTQVGIQAKGVVLRGLEINNCQGRAIGVTASDVRVLNCRVNRTYHGAILLKGGDTPGTAISGIEVVGCVFTDTSLSWVTETRPKGVNGCVNIHNVADSLIANNVVRKGWGEGINVGRGSLRVKIIGNLVYSMNHVLLYFNRCIDCVAEGNLLLHLLDAVYAPNGQWSGGIIFGDERGKAVAKFPNSRGNRVVSNVVVGTGTLLHVRNNRHVTGGYDTQLLDTVIERNTFVAGPGTRGGINIQQNQRGRPHQNSFFRDNIVEFSNAQAGADMATFGSGGGVVFAGNGWSAAPPQSMRGDGDTYGDLRLVAPAAVIEYAGDDTTFNVQNYRPWWNSPVVKGEKFAGALPPFGAPEPPEEPEPPVDPEPPEEPSVNEKLIKELKAVREKVLWIYDEAEEVYDKLVELIALLEDE